MQWIQRSCFFAIVAPAALVAGKIPYTVEFEGIDDPKVLKELRTSSQLIALKKKPPFSINALRFRAESDRLDLIKILQANGFLEAKVDFRLQEDMRKVEVIIQVQLGPQYKIGNYTVTLVPPLEYPTLTAEDVGVGILEPLNTRHVLDSELCALQLLAEHGHPLASIIDRQIVADGSDKTVTVNLTIDPGPLAFFGETTIEGRQKVRSRLIEQQIQWTPGQTYNSCLVESSQEALMETGLFTSVYITHPNAVDSDQFLPMKVEVAEAKHKSISAGASYQTTFGPGVTFGWENRNVAGLGRRLLFQADIAQRSHSGIASYVIPNFHRVGQNYTIQGQAWHESITPYTMQSYSFFNRFDRQVDPCFYFSVGPKVEYMMVTDSVDNGNFALIEAPFYAKWSNVSDPLNPQSGLKVEWHLTPAINGKDGSDFYITSLLSLCSYIPLWGSDVCILAQKWTLGTTFSNGLGAVPVPKRFFGGSEENLRGYKYFTVSPLTSDDDPIGGRSAFYYTLEPRLRVSDCFGIVPFFDLGNVFLDPLPQFSSKWRKSVGIGVRYYSFLGPLRLDVAFPLNRRSGIDPKWWVFVSLGQTF